MSSLKRIQKLEAWAAERLPVGSRKASPLGRALEGYWAGELLTPEEPGLIQPYLEIVKTLVAEQLGYDEGPEAR